MRLALFILLFSTGALAVVRDLEEFKGCVDSLKASQVSLMGAMPFEVFSADRRLFHMSMGIPFLEENYERLREKLAAEASPLERILLANALEGCLTFAGQYRARAIRFSSVLVAILAMLGILTLRVFSSIVPAYAKRSLPPPSDSRAAS